MLFDTEPKEKKEDVFDFEEEYRKLHEAVGAARLIVIKGIRRTGKTTLMKILYNEVGCPKVFIDGRIVTPKQDKIIQLFLQRFLIAVGKHIKTIKLAEVLKEISVKPAGIGATFAFPVALDFDKIDEILAKKKSKLVIFIDEAQRLKQGNISGILAHLFDHTKNTIFVLAGSEIGLLDSIVEDAPELYGRPKEIIELGSIEDAKGKEFLMLGCKQRGKEISEREIGLALDTFDGIIGWLTLFGHYYIRFNDAGRAIEEVRKEARKITSEEIGNFIKSRKGTGEKYLRILEALSIPQRWVALKRILEAQEGKEVNDRIVSLYLDELEKYGFVIKEGEKYVLADPMTREGVDAIIGRR